MTWTWQTVAASLTQRCCQRRAVYIDTDCNNGMSTQTDHPGLAACAKHEQADMRQRHVATFAALPISTMLVMVTVQSTMQVLSNFLCCRVQQACHVPQGRYTKLAACSACCTKHDTRSLTTLMRLCGCGHVCTACANMAQTQNGWTA